MLKAAFEPDVKSVPKIPSLARQAPGIMTTEPPRRAICRSRPIAALYFLRVPQSSPGHAQPLQPSLGARAFPPVAWRGIGGQIKQRAGIQGAPLIRLIIQTDRAAQFLRSAFREGSGAGIQSNQRAHRSGWSVAKPPVDLSNIGRRDHKGSNSLPPMQRA